MRFIWLMGCRDGSNRLGQFLHLSGAMLSPNCRKVADDWNTFWVEDSDILRVTTELLGLEKYFNIQQHHRPDTLPSEPLDWFEFHFKNMVRTAYVFDQPYLVKFGTLPCVWPEFEAMLPDDTFTHELVDIRRNRADRVASLLRLHPGRTEEQAHEFFDRSDAGRNALIAEFRAKGRKVVEASFDAIRANPALLDTVALELGLRPTPEAHRVFDPRKIRTQPPLLSGAVVP